MPGSDEQLREFMDDRMRRVNVAIPGRVERYSSAQHQADVFPLITEKYADGEVLDLPVITNVPVVMPATQGARITLPIAAGDTVLLIFSQRSLDNWLSEGGKVNAGDTRMHSMSDGIAIPGLFSFKDVPTSGPELELTSSQIAMKDAATSPGQVKVSGGKVAIGTKLVELLDEVTKALDATATSTCVNGAPLTLAVQIQAASTAIKTIKGSI
jgi:hypothetical protein